MSKLGADAQVLRSIWFSKPSGEDHAARLESFYGPQASACGCAAGSGSEGGDGGGEWTPSSL